MTRRILQIIPTLDRGGAEKQLVLLAGDFRATSSTCTSAPCRAADRWPTSCTQPAFR